ncbi:MAG: YbhB/YbcL family Raf kinase inhibitor-like protein [Ilumatobacter sp.]
MHGRPTRFLAAITVAALLSACDIGDGTTLQPPTASTTIAPPDTTPLLSEPLDDPIVLDDDQVFEDPALDDPTLDTPPPTLAGEVDAGADFRVFAPWAEGAPIGLIHTCDGANSAPAVSWINAPDNTQEFAISLVDETDLSNGRPFIHWVIAGIDPSVDRIDADVVPDGAVRGLNFFGDVGYTGPCPDPGTSSTYTLTVFALDQQLESTDGTPAAQLLDLVATVAIGATSSQGIVTR